MTSPGKQSHPLGAPWVLWVLLLLSLSLFFFFRFFFCVVSVVTAIVVSVDVAVLVSLAALCSSPPRALDSATHRPDSSQNLAGGMRGAIE